jgi:hypothetical protein
VKAGLAPKVVVRTTPCPGCKRTIKLNNVEVIHEDGRTFIDAAALDFAVRLHLRQCAPWALCDCGG